VVCLSHDQPMLDDTPPVHISITIPTLNEAQNIARVVQHLDRLIASQRHTIDVIVVDDASTDGTDDVVRGLQATRPWLQLIVRSGDRDLSRAVVEGWRASRGNWLGVMDGDLQHPVETWTEMIAHIEAGAADLVMGSRFLSGSRLEGLSGGRTMVSRLAISLAYAFIGPALPRMTDPMSGLFAVPRERIDFEKLRPMGYKILVETAVRSGLKHVEEVPIEFRHRTAGSSKANLRVGLIYALQVLSLAVAHGRWWLVAGATFAPLALVAALVQLAR
jgi:dolichol-phosphate mannosyltransferase